MIKRNREHQQNVCTKIKVFLNRFLKAKVMWTWFFPYFEICMYVWKYYYIVMHSILYTHGMNSVQFHIYLHINHIVTYRRSVLWMIIWKYNLLKAKLNLNLTYWPTIMWMEELFKIKCLVDQKKKIGDLLWAPNYIEIEKNWTLNKEELLTMILIIDDS